MLLVSITNIKKKKNLLVKAILVILLLTIISPYIFNCISASKSSSAIYETDNTNSATQSTSAENTDEQQLLEYWQGISYQLTN